MAVGVQAQAQLSAVRSERETLLATRMELQSLLERAQMEASRARRQQLAAEVRAGVRQAQSRKCAGHDSAGRSTDSKLTS